MNGISLMRSKLRRFRVFVVVGTLALASCGSSSLPPPAQAVPLSSADIESNLSPALPPTERAIMYDALAALRPEDRQAVIYFADGQIYVNDPALADGPFYYAPTTHPGSYEDPSGRLITFPFFDDQGISKSSGAGTGPGYAVYSPPGYTFFQSTVSLPCANMALVKDETAYAYTGGSTGADQADVGLSLTSTTATPTQPRVASPYLAVQGSTGSALPGGDAHASFTCNQSVGMTFYATLVSGVPTIVLALTGKNSIGKPLTIMEKADKSNWTPVCAKCKVKYVTSLIQAGSSLPLGTWAGITSPGTAAHAPTLEWSNILAAHSYQSMPVAVRGWTGNIATAPTKSTSLYCAVLESGTPGTQQLEGLDSSCVPASFQ